MLLVEILTHQSLWRTVFSSYLQQTPACNTIPLCDTYGRARRLQGNWKEWLIWRRYPFTLSNNKATAGKHANTAAKIAKNFSRMFDAFLLDMLHLCKCTLHVRHRQGTLNFWKFGIRSHPRKRRPKVIFHVHRYIKSYLFYGQVSIAALWLQNSSNAGRCIDIDTDMKYLQTTNIVIDRWKHLWQSRCPNMFSVFWVWPVWKVKWSKQSQTPVRLKWISLFTPVAPLLPTAPCTKNVEELEDLQWTLSYAWSSSPFCYQTLNVDTDTEGST